ncbi:putative sperm-associated antigen 17 [Plasmopara halstedii]
MRCWGFHTVALAHDSAEEAISATKDLLNRLNTNGELTSWSRYCSFRVVDRAELDALAQFFHTEELDTKLREDMALEIASSTNEYNGVDVNPRVLLNSKQIEETTRVAPTPSLLALAFQRLVARDKLEFLAHQHISFDTVEIGEHQMQDFVKMTKNISSESKEKAETPARVYLLVDYPSSLIETEELLRLGEVDNILQKADESDNLPLCPLIDGVILIATSMDMLAAARNETLCGVTDHLQPDNGNGGEKITCTAIDKTVISLTTNAFVKMLYEAAHVGKPEWNDFTFTKMTCSADATNLKNYEDFEREFVSSVKLIAAQKFAFKKWLASTTYSVIPVLSDNANSGNNWLYRNYEKVLDGVSIASVSVSTVLFAITEAIALGSSSMISPIVCQNNNSSRFEEFLEYGDLAACRVASAQLYNEMLQADGNSCFLPYSKCRLDEIEKNMLLRGDLPGVGTNGRIAKLDHANLTQLERSVCDTEIASFLTLPRLNCSMVHRTRQLLQIEDMLGSSWKGLLQARAYSENLARTVLPQRIAQVLRENSSDTYLSYYPHTDSLLLVCHPRIASGRMKVSTWVASDHVRHRVAFKNWKHDQIFPQKDLTLQIEAAAGAYIPLSASQLALVATQSWSMYPADHSVTHLYQTCKRHVWLTTCQQGISFGLRPSTEKIEDSVFKDETSSEQQPAKCKPASKRMFYFFASFQDESMICTSKGRQNFSKKPDQLSTIVVTNSFPSGLIVSACSDGCVIQRYAHNDKTYESSFVADCTNDLNIHEIKDSNFRKQRQKCDERETFRVLYGNGSVLRELQCGRREVLLANGIVRVVRACKRNCHKIENSSLNTESITTQMVDPETHALIERHRNGVVVVTFTSGARVTYHVDGTRMYMNAASTHILVKKQRFADVCIDVKANFTAQQHAAGNRVAITKGGLRVRSVVHVYDGTRIEIGYNTKVTAQVNGRVTTFKPKGQVIVAKDNGGVEFNPLEKHVATDSEDDDDQAVTDHTGVYYFNCYNGRFKVCDSEQNRFHVDLCGLNDDPTVVVDLAGEVSEKESARYNVDSISARAVIDELIEPHIFILNGDGTGVEILRPQDIEEFIGKCVETNDQVIYAKETASLSHTFLRELSISTNSSCQNLYFNDPNLHQEMLRLQRPVGVEGTYFSSYFNEETDMFAKQRFTMVRRVERSIPLSADELDEMHISWAKWEHWQKDLEMRKESYKVDHFRQSEEIAQEVVMRKKVKAAYKQSRARKKMARQKVREMRIADSLFESNTSSRKETIQELNVALKDEKINEEDTNSDFEHLNSDLSDEDMSDTLEVDNPTDLLWSTFSQADSKGKGLLSVAQTRLGLANILGIGVTFVELTEVLVQLKLPDPYNVSFNVFADLVEYFRKSEDKICDM